VPVITRDGSGVVSHAETDLPAELAYPIGRTAAFDRSDASPQQSLPRRLDLRYAGARFEPRLRRVPSLPGARLQHQVVAASRVRW